ncbi:MAG: bacillithiol biosynthesis deacetylase BshB1 [Planctomycetes bacterium]|nr:bacillithiol biosynthesis deacetylase BshB1 [Planctomycetota bacterium]
MKLDVLAFAAHRDDVEITCGGTLAKLAERGHVVGACDLTQGEMGTRGTAAERAAEAEAATKILGLAARVNGDLPDAGVFNTREYQNRLVDIVRAYRPETVILPGHDQRHPDHRVTPELVFDACYFAGLAKFGKGAPHRPRKILWVHTNYTPFNPTFIVDIGAQMEKKIASIRAYASQFAPKAGDALGPPGSDVFEWVRARARTYGMMIGKTYGEGFYQREMMEVEDVARVSGQSV